MRKRNFNFYKQPDTMDCGPTCLRMVAKYYGQAISLQTLREKTQIGKEGVNLLGIGQAAEGKNELALYKIILSSGIADLSSLYKARLVVFIRAGHSKAEGVQFLLLDGTAYYSSAWSPVRVGQGSRERQRNKQDKSNSNWGTSGCKPYC